MRTGNPPMKKTYYLIPLLALFFSLSLTTGQYSAAQTEGFNVKTSTEKIADDAEDFVKELTEYSNHNRKDAIPKEIICVAKCFVVLPKISADKVRNDFEGTGMLSCLKTNSDKLSPPLIYKINGLDSFYESSGGIIILVADDGGVKSILANEIDLDSDNTEAGVTGTNKEMKLTKSFIAYAKPDNQNLEGFDPSGSKLVYANKDTFTAYQKEVVPIDILLYNQDIPPALRGFNAALTQLRGACK